VTVLSVGSETSPGRLAGFDDSKKWFRQWLCISGRKLARRSNRHWHAPGGHILGTKVPVGSRPQPIPEVVASNWAATQSLRRNYRFRRYPVLTIIWFKMKKAGFVAAFFVAERICVGT
jgi:hypothetical protein